jgi:hypothetical protein
MLRAILMFMVKHWLMAMAVSLAGCSPCELVWAFHQRVAPPWSPATSPRSILVAQRYY